MLPEDKITEIYQKADFDKSGAQQAKVYSKINKTPKTFKAIWLFAPAAAIIAALILWPQNKQNLIPMPQQNARQEVTQEECVDLSTRYWFEQAAEKGKLIMAKCPKNILNDYNNDFIYHLSQQFEKTNQKLSQDEKRKLDDCGEKFKTVVHPVMSYDVRC